ncbi:MAG: 5-methylthioadenosine/S-adenosylhomocysteine deaminase [Eubacteriales bacterium]|nr:5-methylthioadenosine/S-adenosylhomocysteine deaminase [Eubacteriales bacterium]
MGLLLRGTVVTLTETGILNPGEVAIEGEDIVHVGPSGTTPPDFKVEKVLGGEDYLIIPGFVNCHTHIAMTLLRSYADDLPLMTWLEEKIWPVEAKLSGEDVYWGTMLGIVEMIRSGTTAFADMYFFMDEVARAVEESGIRASLSRGLIGVGPNADEALAENVSLYENWHNRAGGRITVMFGPHAPYTCPPDYLRKVMAAAEKVGAPIHIHVAETRAEEEGIVRDYGKRPVRHLADIGLFRLPTLAAHCVHLNEEDMEILRQHDVRVAHNPQSNLKLASGIAPVPALLQKGVTVGLGTDGASSNNNLDMLEEVRTAALLHKGTSGDPTVLPAEEALAMATREGAKALFIDDRVGTIAAGKKADLVLVNTRRCRFYPHHDPVANLVYAATAQDIDTVMVNGRILMEKGELTTIDEEKVLAMAEKCARRLVGRG